MLSQPRRRNVISSREIREHRDVVSPDNTKPSPINRYKSPDNASTGDKAIPYTLPYFRSSKRVHGGLLLSSLFEYNSDYISFVKVEIRIDDKIV